MPQVPCVQEAGVSPLAYAARAGDLAEVLHLLEADVDPNIYDDVGETPLFEAVVSGHVSVAAALLLGGADPQWQSSIGGMPAELTEEASMAALLKVSSGEVITRDEQDEILAAVDHKMRRKVLHFIQSLMGEHDPGEEASFRPAEPASADGDPGQGGFSSSAPHQQPEEVDLVVRHAIKDSSLTLRVPGSSTFGDVKRAILEMLGSDGQPTPQIYFVKKDRDAYQSYRDRDPLGAVREVRMVGANLPAAG
mmetsp:Transcript_112293/g.349909  ORF Transcript_112293/g.349909 Transcript_112293/m.349909 type:complete len:250 (-) Transcript_112293:221-970(-)